MLRSISVIFAAFVACFAYAAQINRAVVTPPPPGNSFRANLARLYVETSTRDKNDGSITFLASFGKLGSPDTVVTFGERDGFRKITFFTTSASNGAKYNKQAISMYLSVSDCKPPILFFTPRIFRDNWVFLNRVSVLADGDLVVDEPIGPRDQPKRDVYPGGVEETVDLVVMDSKMASFRKIVAAKRINVRITGDKGYVSLTEKEATDFQKDVAANLRIYDAISKIVSDRTYDPC